MTKKKTRNAAAAQHLDDIRANITYLPGLDVYRAIAIIFMIFAHTARLQTGMAQYQMGQWEASFADQLFLWALKYEPVISAMFLFIAGFSLMLSFDNTLTQAGNKNARHKISYPDNTWHTWSARIFKRCLWLYAIAIIFAIAEHGVQWPGNFLSPGILGIIAVALFSGTLMLASRHAVWITAIAILATNVVTFWFESRDISILGINAGDGGLMPLVSIAWFGLMCGWIWQKKGSNGLQLTLGASLLAGVVSVGIDYPWVTYPAHAIRIYPGDEFQRTLYSLQDFFGIYTGSSEIHTARAWNHSSLFLARVSAALVFVLMIALIRIKGGAILFMRPAIWLGRHSLAIYVLHLIMLAAIELSPWRPESGKWSLLLVTTVTLLSCLLIAAKKFLISPATVFSKRFTP